MYILQKSLGLNIVIYVFDNVIQVAMLGWETVNIVMYILKDFFNLTYVCNSKVQK